MIVTCPECAARYRLADGAIPPEGRSMRCASCQNRWFALPPDDASAPALTAATNDPPAGVAIAPLASTLAMAGPTPRFEPALPAPPPVFEAWSTVDDDDAQRGSPVVKTVFAVVLGLALTAGAAALWMPDLPPLDTSRVPWLDTLLHPAARAASPLALDVAVERQPLGDGRTVFALTGTIRNPTATTQPVEGLEGRLLNARGQLAYSWAIASPVARLAPGATARFEASAVGAGSERVTVALR